jgi:hypothetical protein
MLFYHLPGQTRITMVRKFGQRRKTRAEVFGPAGVWIRLYHGKRRESSACSAFSFPEVAARAQLDLKSALPLGGARFDY